MFPDLTRDDVFSYETARLWLRWPRAADAPALQVIAGHEDVASMTATWPHPLPDGEAERRIFRMRQDNAAGTGLALALTPKAHPNRLIGTIGGRFSENMPDFGFGYMLDPQKWNRGLMSEAVAALADLVFGLSRAETMWGLVMSCNPASRRVLENGGFRHTGSREEAFTARGGVVACDHFGLSRGDWARRSLLLSSNWHPPAVTSPSTVATTLVQQGGDATCCRI